MESLRIPFRILKCQAKGCKEKATHTFGDGRSWFCDEHYNWCKEEMKRGLKWMQEQEEKKEQDLR